MTHISLVLLSCLLFASVCDARSTVSFSKLEYDLRISELEAMLPSTTIVDSFWIDIFSDVRRYRRYYPIVVNDEAGILIVKIGWEGVRTEIETAESFEWIRATTSSWGFPPDPSRPVKGLSDPVDDDVFERVVKGFEEDLGGPFCDIATIPAWGGWSLEYCKSIGSIRMFKNSRYAGCKRDWFCGALNDSIDVKRHALGSRYATVKQAGGAPSPGGFDEYRSMAGMRSLEMKESLFGIRGRTMYTFEGDSLVMSIWTPGPVTTSVFEALQRKLAKIYAEGTRFDEAGMLGMIWESGRVMHYIQYIEQGDELMFGSLYPDFKLRYEARLPEYMKEMQEESLRRQREIDSLYRDDVAPEPEVEPDPES